MTVPRRLLPHLPGSSGAPLLLLLLAACVALAGNTPQASSGAAGSAPPGPGPLARIEAEVHAGINAHRLARGLAPLQPSQLLASLAREHSELIAAGRRPFGHDGFEQRVQTMRETLTLSGVSENVAYNDYPSDQTAARAVEGWLQSAGHRENLEGPYSLTGIGVARSPAGRYVYTQLFASMR